MTIRADPARFQQFMEIYEEKLEAVASADPVHYPWYEEGLGAKTVAQKMGAAILGESYNKDGRAFRATCRALGIKYTYAAIRAFLENAVTAQGD